MRTKDEILRDAKEKLKATPFSPGKQAERLIWMEIALDVRDTLVAIQAALP